MKMSYDVGKSLSNKAGEPELSGYQLIGDSQFLRFSEKVLNLKRKEKNGVFHLGFCVSGQRIKDLLHRVQVGFADVSEKIVLMIGTNDLLRGTSFEAMRQDFDKLLNLLRKDAKKIILLTIPPVLKLENDEDHWNRLKKYNDYIRQCRDDENIFVGDVYAKLIVPKMWSPKKKSLTNSPNPAKRRKCCESTPLSQSKMDLVNCSSSPKSTSIQSLKEMKSHRRMHSPSTSDYDEVSNSSKRSLQLPPCNQAVTPILKKARRRPLSDPESYPDDCQPPAAKKCSLSAEEKTTSDMSNSLYVERVFGNFLSSLRPSDSFTTPSGRTRMPEGKYDLPFFSSSLRNPSSDSFATPSGRTRMSKGKYDFPFYSSSFFSGDDHLIPPSRQLTPQRKCESYFPLTTSSSGSDVPFTVSSRRKTLNEKFGSYSNPRSISSGGDNLGTPLKRAVIPERKCNSPFFVRSSSVGEDNLCITPPRRISNPLKRCNSYSRANDNHTTEEEVNIENADKIRKDCFEDYFAGYSRRPDLIHLNIKGLCILKGIIQGIIDDVG